MTAQLSPAEEPGLDRRRFLKLSSTAAVAAAVPLPAAAPSAPAPARAEPSAQPNLYGRWFAV